MIRSLTIYSFVILSVISTSCVAQTPFAEAKEHNTLVVYLVRHAEKADTSRDPDLSQEGKQRAQDLIHTLGDAGIENIYSSDYIRTRETAAPLAKRLGLEIQIYDPRDLESIANKLKELGGIHLVVGHSNTTPNLCSILGGNPGSPIDEKKEYDRLYQITIDDKKTINSTLLRYGKPSMLKTNQISKMGKLRKQKDQTTDDGNYVITAPIVSHQFKDEQGNIIDKEYYIQRSVQDYYIKFSESAVSKEEIESKLSKIAGDIKTLTLEIEYKSGDWDEAPPSNSFQIRGGDYVIVYRIL